LLIQVVLSSYPTNIGELDLLRRVYGKIATTPEVAQEFGEPLPEWVVIKATVDRYRQRILEMQVDKGEASAIALALEITDCTIILDDYKARKVAAQLGIEMTGTLGVIVKAKLKGLITSVKPYLEKIKLTDFRLTDELMEKIPIEAKE
jgi:predicted nucleic acid-binding protein